MYQVAFGARRESDREIATDRGRDRGRLQEALLLSFDLGKEGKEGDFCGQGKRALRVYGLWRDVFTGVASENPGIQTEFTFVDAITMWFVKNPEWFDVVVTPNMFGDIITDLGAMIQGGMGLAPGGINPVGTSMFEPIHGSAPKYKGMGVANPFATIWAGAMMLDHIGEPAAGAAIVSAIERAIGERKVTRDMGGSLSTSQVGEFVAAALK